MPAQAPAYTDTAFFPKAPQDDQPDHTGEIILYCAIIILVLLIIGMASTKSDALTCVATHTDTRIETRQAPNGDRIKTAVAVNVCDLYAPKK